MTKRAIAAGLLASAMLASCDGSPTQIIATIHLDDIPARDVARVTVTASWDFDKHQLVGPLGDYGPEVISSGFPGDVVIRPSSPDESRPVFITVDAQIGTGPAHYNLAQKFRGYFIRRQTQWMHFQFTSLCHYFTCPTGQNCVPSPPHSAACALTEQPLLTYAPRDRDASLSWPDASRVDVPLDQSNADVADVTDATDATDTPDIPDVIDEMSADVSDVTDGCDGATCGGTCVDLMTERLHCGACGNACSNGMICTAGACACPSGTSLDCGGACAVCDDTLTAPRQIAPLSSATVTSQRPTLRWEAPSGTSEARVELCADRACTRSLGVLDVMGSTARPSSDLSPGVVFWRVRGRSGARAGSRSSPLWFFTVPTRSATGDTSWGIASTDINGDGYSDVVVTSIGPSPDFLSRGSLFYGRSAMLGASTLPESVSLDGISSVALGDVNGDGRADVVGCNVFHDSSRGRLLLFLTDATGALATTPVPVSGSTAAGHFCADHSVGDVNGDGFADVFVGANSELRARLFLGGPGGLSSTPAATLGPADGGGFSFSTEVVGDVNGDGYPDVAVGANEAMSTGRVYVYHGAAGGLVSTSPSAVLEPTATSDVGFGHKLAGGDINRDGYADIVVSEWKFDRCNLSLEVFFGSASGVASRATVQLRDPTGCSSGSGSSWFSRNLQLADVNGDGYADVVTSAPHSATAPRGQVLIYLGRADASRIESLPSLPWLVQPAPSSNTFGESLSRPFDFDGDGRSDIVVGAPRPGAASAFLFFGSRIVAGDGAPATILTRSGDPDFGTYISRAWTPRRGRRLFSALR